MVAKIFVTSSDWEALNNRSVIYIQSPIAPSEDRKIECLTSLIWSPGGILWSGLKQWELSSRGMPNHRLELQHCGGKFYITALAECCRTISCQELRLRCTSERRPLIVFQKAIEKITNN